MSTLFMVAPWAKPEINAAWGGGVLNSAKMSKYWAGLYKVLRVKDYPHTLSYGMIVGVSD